MSTTRLLDHFSAPDDPRQSWKVTYPLPEVQLLTDGGYDEIAGPSRRPGMGSSPPPCSAISSSPVSR